MTPSTDYGYALHTPDKTPKRYRHNSFYVFRPAGDIPGVAVIVHKMPELDRHPRSYRVEVYQLIAPFEKVGEGFFPTRIDKTSRHKLGSRIPNDELPPQFRAL